LNGDPTLISKQKRVAVGAPPFIDSFGLKSHGGSETSWDEEDCSCHAQAWQVAPSIFIQQHFAVSTNVQGSNLQGLRGGVVDSAFCPWIINSGCMKITRISDLGAVHTMDHEVIPWPCKICDWLLNSSQDHFNLHQEKKMPEWSWVRGSQLETYFQGLCYSPTWCNGFCGGRGESGAMVEKGKGPWQKKIVMIKFYWFFILFYLGGGEGQDKDKRMVKLDFFFLPIFSFLDIY
jgi:hypothetical protein